MSCGSIYVSSNITQAHHHEDKDQGHQECEVNVLEKYTLTDALSKYSENFRTGLIQELSYCNLVLYQHHKVSLSTYYNDNIHFPESF